MKRNILAVTGARSEYDILFPVLNELQNISDIDLKLVITGSHLSDNFGKTINQILKDGFTIADKLYTLVDTNDKIGRIISLGHQIPALAQCFDREKPDLVLVIGDREESIATAMTCAYMSIVCAHMGGGDIAKDGNIDNSVRYAASKFAQLHFVFLKEHKETLLKLGEDEWRIKVCGNPALDRFVHTPHLTKNELSKILNTKLDDQYIVLIQHPTINTFELEEIYINETLEAIKQSGVKCFVNHPNSDAGNYSIVNAIDKIKNDPQFYIFKNLDRLAYVNLLRHSSCLVGNSSSGIIEAPSIGLPVVNVGIRQKGRLNAGNVIFVANNKIDILVAINKSLNDSIYIKTVKQISNPYGDGKSGQAVAEILATIEINNTLTYKNITY